jgi:hypothetical protein
MKPSATNVSPNTTTCGQTVWSASTNCGRKARKIFRVTLCAAEAWLEVESEKPR